MEVITVLFQLLRARSAGEFLSATLLLCKNFDQLMSPDVASEKPPDCGQKKATVLCSRSAIYTFSLFFLALPVFLMTDYTFKFAVITFKLHLAGDATVRVGRCLTPGRPVNPTKISFEYHWTGFFLIVTLQIYFHHLFSETWALVPAYLCADSSMMNTGQSIV